MEDNAAGGGRRWPKFPGWLRKNVGPQEQTGCEERAARELPGQPLTTGRDALALADWVESKDGDRKLARRDDELETTGRMLAAREEELLGGARPSEECVDRLWRDLEVLKLRALTAVQQSFTCDDADHLAGHLSDAVAAVRLQEELDRRWAGSDHAPWRPLKCLASHNALLADVAESRLEEAARDGERDRALRLSTPVKRRVSAGGVAAALPAGSREVVLTLWRAAGVRHGQAREGRPAALRAPAAAVLRASLGRAQHLRRFVPALVLRSTERRHPRRIGSGRLRLPALLGQHLLPSVWTDARRASVAFETSE